MSFLMSLVFCMVVTEVVHHDRILHFTKSEYETDNPFKSLFAYSTCIVYVNLSLTAPTGVLQILLVFDTFD